jgi:hypothetical protein
MIDSIRKAIKASREKYSDTLYKLRKLEAIPVAFRTPKICLKYVKKYGRELGSVPEALKTAELCAIAVEEDAWAFEFVPDKFKTPELCMKAVTGDSMESMLAFVPPELKTLELCAAAIVHPVFDDHYRFIPEHLQEQVKEIEMEYYEKKLPKPFNVKYKTKQFGEISFHVHSGSTIGSTDLKYDNQKINIFIPDIWTHTEKITPCLNIIEKYFEINNMAKNELLNNYKENKVIKEYFKYNYRTMYNEERLKVFSTVKYRKIDFPAIIKNLSYPVLHIRLNDENNNKLEVSLDFILAKDSVLRGHLLEVHMNENLTISGYEHGEVLLD